MIIICNITTIGCYLRIHDTTCRRLFSFLSPTPGGGEASRNKLLPKCFTSYPPIDLFFGGVEDNIVSSQVSAWRSDEIMQCWNGTSFCLNFNFAFFKTPFLKRLFIFKFLNYTFKFVNHSWRTRDPYRVNEASETGIFKEL